MTFQVSLMKHSGSCSVTKAVQFTCKIKSSIEDLELPMRFRYHEHSREILGIFLSHFSFCIHSSKMWVPLCHCSMPAVGRGMCTANKFHSSEWGLDLKIRSRVKLPAKPVSSRIRVLSNWENRPEKEPSREKAADPFKDSRVSSGEPHDRSGRPIPKTGVHVAGVQQDAAFLVACTVFGLTTKFWQVMSLNIASCEYKKKQFNSGKDKEQIRGIHQTTWCRKICYWCRMKMQNCASQAPRTKWVMYVFRSSNKGSCQIQQPKRISVPVQVDVNVRIFWGNRLRIIYFTPQI